MLTHFSLFSGIGGIDLAADQVGFVTVGQCEIKDYPYKVLCKHWPNVPKWRDIKDVSRKSLDERGIGEVTVLSGGFPCQPHSLAGKRKASSDERDLWGEYARVICEVRPKWVLGENVPGLLTSEDGRFFGGILNDLASMGYDAGWCMYGADKIDAVHKRERIFITAYSRSVGRMDEKSEKHTNNRKQQAFYKSSKSIDTICNTYGITKLQTDKTSYSSGEKRNSWESSSREHRGEPSRSYWEEHKPPVCGVDDGISTGLDKDRLIALGNAVCPQQVYPILKAIHDIEMAVIG